LIVWFRLGAGAGTGIGWPAGWTELADATDAVGSDRFAVAYRYANGSEGASIVVTHATWYKAAACAWRITGADSTTPPVISTIASSSNGHPDPPSLTPAGGANDYLWLGIGGIGGEQTLSSYPTNYSLGQLFASSGTADGTSDNCRAMGAARQLNAASENPGQFTMSATAGVGAYTIAVYPAPAGGGALARSSVVMVG